MKTLRSVQLFLVAGLLAEVAAAPGDPLDNWHQLDTNTPVPVSIPFGTGKWLKLDGQQLLSSTNKVQWTVARTFPLEEFATDLAFGRGRWVLAGTRYSTNTFVLTSGDGETWNAPVTPQIQGGFARILQSPEEWVVWAASGRLLRSPDGQNWTSSQLGIPPLSSSTALIGWGIENILYADGHWVAAVNEYHEISGIGSLVVSTNLTEWQWWFALPGGELGELFYDLKYAHGLWFGLSGDYWVGCGVGTAVITSTDGRNWTRRFSAPRPGPELYGQVDLVDNRLVAIASYRGCAAICTNCPPPIPPVFESAPLVSLQQNRLGDLTIHRAAGIPVVLESSDNLHQWNTLTNLPLGAPVQPFTDSAGSNLPARFYRARTP